MRDFLLDTQTIHYWYNKDCAQHQAIIGNVEALIQQSSSISPKPKLLVSVITLGEIAFGHRVQGNGWSMQNAAKFTFVRENLPGSLEITEDAVAAYADIRARVFNRNAPGNMRKPGMRPEQLVDPLTSLALTIQENDLWLCAQAVGHGMVLVTNDRMRAIREVTRNMAPNLKIQNWTVAGTAALE